LAANADGGGGGASTVGAGAAELLSGSAYGSIGGSAAAGCAGDEPVIAARASATRLFLGFDIAHSPPISAEAPDDPSNLPELPRKILGRWRRRIVRCCAASQRIIVAGMSSSAHRSVRRPAVAGLFYPAQEQECARVAEGYVRSGDGRSGESDAPRWIGANVPHAGWVWCGAIAGEAIGAVRRSLPDRPVDVVVVFAAVHTPLRMTAPATLATYDAWQAPGRVSDVPGGLSGKLTVDTSQLFGVDDRFHQREHAVEVELPLIQRAWPDASVLPVEVPLTDEAVQVGRRTAGAVQALNLRAVYLASSDLTHYGPAYQFAPAGVGPEALEWAKENDRRLLSVVTDMTPEAVVPHVREHLNACGGGAIAAMLAACREHGAARASVLRHANSYEVLRHANSYEVLRDIAPGQRPDNAVGYAAVVVG
jgi:AmmeMemoRadiSam system protein B